jgi:hypothetical protein
MNARDIAIAGGSATDVATPEAAAAVRAIARADLHCHSTASELAASPLLRRRLAAAALAAVRLRTWEAAMERLAEGYRRALEQPRSASGASPGARRAA